MTPITPVAPAAAGLGGDLSIAAEAVALAVDSIEAAGDEAKAFTRVAITVQSEEAVDKLAAEWNVTARWSMQGVMYVAHKTVGQRRAEVEVVYYAPAKKNGAAA